MDNPNLTGYGLLALALTVALKWAGVFAKILDTINPKRNDDNHGNGRSGQKSVAEWEQRIDKIVESRLAAKLGVLEPVIYDTCEKVNRLVAYAEMDQRRR